MAPTHNPQSVKGGTDWRKRTISDREGLTTGYRRWQQGKCATRAGDTSFSSRTAELQEFNCINVAAWAPTEMISYFLAAAQVGADACGAAYHGHRPCASADRFANGPAK